MAFPNNSIRTATLNTGHEIPFIGLGIWPSSSSRVEIGVKTALEAGCRHIDTNAASGNESAVGAAIRASHVARGEIFLTIKLADGDHLRVPAALEESLEKLGVDYVDLYLLCWPRSSVDSSEVLGDGWDYVQVWAEMQKLVEVGKVRSIGVSGFGKGELERLLGDGRCTITPAVNQLQLHPAHHPDRKLVAYHTLHGIHTTAYSPIGLKDSPLDDHHPLNLIAKGKGKSVEQILLRWALHRGWSVIPTLDETNESVQAGLFDWDGWALTISGVKAIENL